MRPSYRSVIDDYLRRHDGVVTLAHAQAAGMSKHAVSRRLRSGQWRRCSAGVYFADDRPFTDAARVRSAVWGYGERAVASGFAAAWWYGLTRYPPGIVGVTVPRDSDGRSRAGTRVRRRDLAGADIDDVRGLRITAYPLTVLEAAVSRRDGAKIMDAALQGAAELRSLWRAQLRNKGRYGSPAARRLLQGAADGTRSHAERLLLQIVRSAGLTGWQTNYPVAGYRIDVAFVASKIAVETDGFAFHSDPDAFHRDRVRQNRLALLGWQVLRFTWLDLTEYPDRVAATLQAAISA